MTKYDHVIPNWMKLSRRPDVVIGDNYMNRWWILPRNPLFNIYLHRITADDEGRDLHDHPWSNISIILKGVYRELMPFFQPNTDGECIWKWKRVHRHLIGGRIVYRNSLFAHRLEVVEGPVWSLFITGPSRRDWGFHTEHGWISHHEYQNRSY